MLLMFDGEEPLWVPTMKLLLVKILLNGIEGKEPAINNDIMIDIGCSYIHRIDNPT